MSRSPAPLSDEWYWLLIVVFGAVSVALIRWLDLPHARWLELLGLSTGSAAIVTALLWFAVLGAQRHPLWVLALLVPYVNLVAASAYARRYWSEDARGPALLALAGVIVQTAASLQMLAPALPPLV